MADSSYRRLVFGVWIWSPTTNLDNYNSGSHVFLRYDYLEKIKKWQPKDSSKNN
jgi:hypothetical protein